MNRTHLITVLLLPVAAAACVASSPLTERQEYFVGRSVSANLLSSHKLYQSDPGLYDYLAMVGMNLAEVSDRPNTYKGYRFALLDDPAVNAFAAPGGFIFITTGALKAMDNEEELAGVLAHEIAHVVLKHPEAAANAANQKRQAGEAILKVGEFVWEQRNPQEDPKRWAALKGVFQGVIDDVVLDLIEKGYNRDQEYEADRLGTELLSRLGYNPGGLRDFLGRLERNPAAKGSPRLLGWMGRTHPQPGDRVQRLNAQLATLKTSVTGVEVRRVRFQEKLKTLK